MVCRAKNQMTVIAVSRFNAISTVFIKSKRMHSLVSLSKNKSFAYSQTASTDVTAAATTSSLSSHAFLIYYKRRLSLFAIYF